MQQVIPKKAIEDEEGDSADEELEKLYGRNNNKNVKVVIEEEEDVKGKGKKPKASQPLPKYKQ